MRKPQHVRLAIKRDAFFLAMRKHVCKKAPHKPGLSARQINQPWHAVGKPTLKEILWRPKRRNICTVATDHGMSGYSVVP